MLREVWMVEEWCAPSPPQPAGDGWIVPPPPRVGDGVFMKGTGGGVMLCRYLSRYLATGVTDMWLNYRVA